MHSLNPFNTCVLMVRRNFPLFDHSHIAWGALSAAFRTGLSFDVWEDRSTNWSESSNLNPEVGRWEAQRCTNMSFSNADVNVPSEDASCTHLDTEAKWPLTGLEWSPPSAWRLWNTARSQTCSRTLEVTTVPDDMASRWLSSFIQETRFSSLQFAC